MRQADAIRGYVIEHFIQTARQAGRVTVLVKAAEVHAALDLENRYPAVCSALDAGKFLDAAQVTLVKRSGPRQGSRVEWVFEV